MCICVHMYIHTYMYTYYMQRFVSRIDILGTCIYSYTYVYVYIHVFTHKCDHITCRGLCHDATSFVNIFQQNKSAKKPKSTYPRLDAYIGVPAKNETCK